MRNPAFSSIWGFYALPLFLIKLLVHVATVMRITPKRRIFIGLDSENAANAHVMAPIAVTVNNVVIIILQTPYRIKRTVL
jgi:hypothetical protein